MEPPHGLRALQTATLLQAILMRPVRSVILLGSLACFLWSAASTWAEGGLFYELAIRPSRPAVKVSIQGQEARSAVPRLPSLLNRKTSPIAFLRLSPLEERLFADAADGRWDEHSLLTASLVASGVTDGQVLRRYEDQVAGLIEELHRSGAVEGTPRPEGPGGGSNSSTGACWWAAISSMPRI